MSFFRDYTYQAETKEQYVDLIEKALIEDNADLHLKREKFARQHTWRNNVLQISNALKVTKSRNQKGMTNDFKGKN